MITKKFSIGLIVLLAALTATLAPAPAQGTAVSVIGGRVSSTTDRARIVIDLSAETEFSILAFGEPRRIAVDVRADSQSGDMPDLVAGEGLISGFSHSPSDNGVVRTEVSLTAPATIQQAYFLEPFDDQPARLVIDLIASDETAFAELTQATSRTLGLPEQDMPVIEPTPPGESSLSYSTRPLIVIDPGHGGLDGGAVADNGILEKQVVLAFAKTLQDLLIATDRFDVALTRYDDSYVTLEDRIALARQNRADLFLSVHADSFGGSAFAAEQISGAAVYVRGAEPTDDRDADFADRENIALAAAGLEPTDAGPELTGILTDLMQRETRRLSFMAAESLVGQLEPSVQVRETALRQANFIVLQAPEVPSVLIELGFLSNSDESSNMTASEWQDRMASATARGIAGYFDRFATP